MMKHVLLLLIIAFLSGCIGKNVPTWREWMFDHPPGGAEKYPPLYVKGWQDGCETAGASTANHMYKFKFTYRQDEELTHTSKPYAKGWDDAYLYCTSYLLQHNFDWFGKRPI